MGLWAVLSVSTQYQKIWLESQSNLLNLQGVGVKPTNQTEKTVSPRKTQATERTHRD